MVAQSADVRDRASLKTALKAGVEELGGRLDIVVANAGIAPMAGEDAWQDVIDVNLTGVYHTIDVAMRPMIKAGNGGAIVLTSSVAGLVGLAAPQAGSIGYAAAKHGIVGLMRVYANLLGSLNIRVNSIHPAAVRTPMVENEFTRAWLADMANNAGGNSSVQMETIEPEEVADTVAFLVSDSGRHISGTDAARRRRVRQQALNGSKSRCADRIRTDGAGGHRAVRAARAPVGRRRPRRADPSDRPTRARSRDALGLPAPPDGIGGRASDRRLVGAHCVSQALHR